MEQTLTELCKELNKYFCKNSDKIHGKYKIENGKITPSVGLIEGQYFRLVGSVLNDKVYRCQANDGTVNETLKDEPEFDGAIWKMRVPQDVIELAEAISEWRAKNEAVDSSNMSPFQSESFGIYSYSKGSSGQSKNGAGATAVTWQTQFASQLSKYRRIWGI